MQHLAADIVRPLWRSVRLFALLSVALVALISARPASAQTSSSLPAAWAITPLAGTVNVLVVGCYFADTHDPPVLSRATEGIKRMYGSKNETPTIAQYFDRVSNGKIQIVADVKGWYRLPHNFDTYNSQSESAKTQDADCQARVEELFDENAYRVVVMLFNADTGMRNHADDVPGKYIALRPLGGHGGWVNHATHVHEIGHALGLPHSHTVDEPADAYSNPYDPISGFDETSKTFFYFHPEFGWCNGYYDLKAQCVYENTGGQRYVAAHYSAYQKVRLGWLSAGATNTHSFFGGQASYVLQALGSHNYTEKQMIAIPIDATRFYAVEYRKRDADYYEGGLKDEGVVVYRVDPAKTDDPGDGTMMRILHAGDSFSGENDIVIQYAAPEAPDKARVHVRGPVPAPTLTSITPNYGASTRNSTIGYLPVTLEGSNFVPASSAQWDGVVLDGQGVTGGGYTTPSTLQVRVLDSLLRAGRSGFVSVVHYTHGGPGSNQSSTPLPFFVSPSGAATVKSASTTQASSARASVVADNLTVSSTGTGSLAAATLASSPAANATFPSADRWYTALISQNSTFASVETRHCDVNGGTLLRWWDGSSWKPVSPAAKLDTDKCLTFTAKADGSTAPNIEHLRSGVLLGVGRGFGLTNINTPAQVEEGTDFQLVGGITTPSTDRMGLNVEWGDGGSEWVWLAGKTATFSRQHRYADNPKTPSASYKVRLTLTDSTGVVASTFEKSIKVVNAAPIPSIKTYIQSEAPGNPVTAYIHFSDKGLVGTSGDTHTASIDWGDGRVDSVAVPIAQGGFAATHVYSPLPGLGPTTVDISVTVTDDDGASGTAKTPFTILFGTTATRVVMCSDFNYGGTCRIMREPELANMMSIGAYNDYLSSISIEGPAVVSVFSDINFQGRCETFRASDPRLDDNYIGNDSISSMRVGTPCP